jgi:magnesium chelatase family protein
MNLCPCGGRADPAAECSCTSQQLARFRAKLSQALLDRFDLVVTMPRPRSHELASGPSETSLAVRERVTTARGRLDTSYPVRSEDASTLLDRAVDRLPLSGRGRARVARVAATIAALAGAERVAGEHVAEALSYRSPRELAV